jgi:nitrogen regulatory protein P-II 2
MRGTVSALSSRAPNPERIQAYRTMFINVASRPDSHEMQLMKMITAVVRPFKLDELRHAIAQLGVQGVTVTEVYEAEFGPRAKLEIAVDDSIVEPVLEAIANVSRTGRTGDGKIIVGNLEQAIRIRTGETGTAAT